MVDRRLGRGLDFFLSGGKPPSLPASPAVRSGLPDAARVLHEEVLQVDVTTLAPSPFQPRKQIGEAELQDLANSIRTSGVLQPILARRIGDRFEIVAGERRWRASKLAGLAKVPVLVRTISDQDAALFSLVENLQREDLNAIEKALGFKLLVAQSQATQEEVAKRVGLDRSTVANFLRLLDLPDDVQAHVSRGTLSMGHARCLLALPDAETISACATEAIKQAWSVRALESRVNDLLEQSKGQPSTGLGAAAKTGGKSRPVWLNELEETLVDTLGTPVTIRYGRKRAQIIVDCAGREEFERVFQRLKNC